MKRIFIIFYSIILLVHLIAGSLGYNFLEWASKPLLLSSLLFFFIFSTQRMDYGKFRKLIVGGLFFSFIGDVLLMFQAGSSRYFALGLGAFLIAHICYLWAFTKVYLQNHQVELIKKQGWIMILILGYGIFFFRAIKEHLGKMAGPVIAYITVISLMLLLAVNRYGRVGTVSFWLIAIGALLFVASDSLLAWNKFMHHLTGAHILIMGTYGIAQLCIMLGALRQVKATAGLVTE